MNCESENRSLARFISVPSVVLLGDLLRAVGVVEYDEAF